MKLRLLGDLTAREFLRRYWQKRPLVVRRAVNHLPALSLAQLKSLAARDEVESRIVERRGSRRETLHGPFGRIRTKSAPWTLLVNGVNLHVPSADELLQRFDFVPQARLDDVMVSYATRGGGVGPHVDRYDVFLVQGPGRRAWRFDSERVVLAPGDLLYLPPGVRHDGVALEPCFTFSIGFRAPRGVELAAAFLDWLHERGLPDGEYRDPSLQPARGAGRVPEDMISFAEKVLKRIRWSREDIGRFLGEYLSEPKPHVVFEPGASRGSLPGSTVRLHAKTRLLYRGARFFMNGESFTVERGARALRELADRRAVAGARLVGGGLGSLIWRWQRQGYLNLEKV